MGLVFLIVGVSLLLGAFWQYKKSKDFIAKAFKTTAIVVDIIAKEQTSTDSDGYTTTTTFYYPVFEYTGTNGKHIKKQYDIGTSNARTWTVGNQVDIYYDPDNPEKFKVAKKLYIYFVAALLLFMGLVFGIIGLVILVSS